MSVLATETSPSALQGQRIPQIWKPLLVSSLLLGVLFAPMLAKMVQEWIDLEEMGHGFFCACGGRLDRLDRARSIKKS